MGNRVEIVDSHRNSASGFVVKKMISFGGKLRVPEK